MASGKNIVSSILEQNGFACIDADKAAHLALENSKEKILTRFSPLAKEKGVSLLNTDGSLNRRSLASIVFSSKELLSLHESIVYPETERIINSFIEENSKNQMPLIVINAAVLYKTPSLMQKAEHILYVDAPLPLRFIRAKKRDSLSTKMIFERFASQAGLFAKYKKSNADILRVWNIGSKKRLKKKIEAFLVRQGIKKWNKKEHYGF